MTERRLPKTAVENLVEDLASKANADLSNLNATGQAKFDEKANVALTNSPYTTNRILEIPQNIKLELNNGTLTLKAGSKVYVPNGAGTFNTVTIASDVSTERQDNQDCIAWYNTDTGTIQLFPSILFYSGTTAPSGYQFMFWYDITNNKCKVTSDSGSTWVEGKSFPICVVSTDGAKISAIKQVFNGFGYIGSTVFALPGVKVQTPNGKNTDGTYKSVLYTQQNVSILTISWGSLTGKYPLFLRQDTNGLDGSAFNYYFVSSTTQLPSNDCLFYDSKTNLTGGTESGNIYYFMNVYVGTMTLEAGVLKGVNVETVDSILNSSLSNLSAAGQAKFDAKADKSQFQVVSALPANPDPNVFYFIPG